MYCVCVYVYTRYPYIETNSIETTSKLVTIPFKIASPQKYKVQYKYQHGQITRHYQGFLFLCGRSTALYYCLRDQTRTMSRLSFPVSSIYLNRSLLNKVTILHSKKYIIFNSLIFKLPPQNAKQKL